MKKPINIADNVQIALLYNLGIETFGDKDKFDQWLATENLAWEKENLRNFLIPALV